MTAAKVAVDGRETMARFEGALASLGVAFVGEWARKDVFEGVAELRGEPAFRMRFTAAEHAVSINLYPLDPGSTKLVGHWPSIDATEFGPGPSFERRATDKYVAAAVEDVESFFRALAVKKGILARREFPTEASLSTWYGRARKGKYRRHKALDDLERDVARGKPEAVAMSEGRMARFMSAFARQSHLGFLLPGESGPPTVGPR